MSARAFGSRLLLPLTLLASPCAAEDAMAPLWVSPTDLESRDLFYGPGGPELVPSPDVPYRFKTQDTRGHSGGYKVEDPRGRKWKVKVGDEVESEIAVSRILWAIGYRQPVMHYLAQWRMTGGPKTTPQPGRFRLESDHANDGEWSWDDNPFVHSRPFRGLVVANILLNNWDLATSNNRIYRVKRPGGAAVRWYVVQDLGGSLGRTHWPIGGRNDIDGFESQAFIQSVHGDRVDLDYHGPHRSLVEDLTVADVLWTCRLLSRLSDRQLLDAFRAAGYPEDVQQRYVRKVRRKIDEGRALERPGGAPR